MIPDAQLDELKARAAIETVGAALIPGLRQQGRLFKACCPFHQEKTPSFTIDPDKGSYKCYGCGLRGDVIDLVCRLRGLDFAGAVRDLAREAGMEISFGKPQSPQQRQERQRQEQLREQMLRINQAAQDFFVKTLRSGDPEANDALEYLFSRGLPLEILDRYGVGYAPKDRQALQQALYAAARRPGPKVLELAEAAGLFGRSESNSGDTNSGSCPRVYRYPRFRGRVTVPILVQGKVASFGGRIVPEPDRENAEGAEKAKKKPPKYVNGPETEIFCKSEVLFGLGLARQAIRASGVAVVVEGYIDVLACAALGVENAVAVMGTAFTDKHARALKLSGAQSLVAMLDADKAGEQAYEKLLPVCLSAGLTVRKARL